MTFIYADINNAGAGLFGLGASTTCVTVAHSGEAVFRLKELLKAAGWVIQSSSDGTNFSNTPGNTNDQISTTTEMNTSGAWFVIKQPAIGAGLGAPGGRQFGFRRGATEGSWVVAYYPLDAANVAQTPGTPGTATALPVFTIQQALKGTLPGTGTTWFSGTLSTTTLFSCGADNAAPFGFYCFGYTRATLDSSTCGGHMMFDPIQDAASQDNDPYVIYIPNASSQFPWTYNGLASTTLDDRIPFTYLLKGLTGEGFVNISAPVYMQNGAQVAPPPGGSGVGRAISTNVHNGKDEILPVFYIRRGSDALPVGSKGKSSLLRWKAVGHTSAMPLDVSGTRDRILIGDCILPWDGSRPRW